MAEKHIPHEEIEETDSRTIDTISKRNIERPLRGGWPVMNIYLQKHRKLVTYLGGGIIAIILLTLAYKYFIIMPKEQEASQAIFIDQQYFQQDSFGLALRGNGQEPGFQELADDYGSSPSGNLAKYYTGISLMHEKKYDEAIDYLKDFDADDEIIKPLALGAIGDAYSQQKNYDEAASYYKKAAESNENKFTTPRFLLKLGLVDEKLGNYQDALDAYKKIQEKYSTTPQAVDIVKLIGRAMGEVDAGK
jgi:tetratricopeptide (TPR) repeat protein